MLKYAAKVNNMRILLSLTALLLSVILLQLSSGGLGPLDALSGFELNFTTAQIGLFGVGALRRVFHRMLVGSAPAWNGGTFAGFRRVCRHRCHRPAGAYADHRPHRLGADAGCDRSLRGGLLYRDRGLVAGESDEPDPWADHWRLSGR